MADEAKELQIKLTGEAKTAVAAADATTAALAETKVSVEELAKSLAESNAKSGEWGKTLGQLTNEQLLQLEERLRADIKAAEQLGQNADELKKKLADVYNLRSSGLETSLQKSAEGSQKLAAGGHEAAKGLHAAKESAEGLKRVMHGLDEGGIVGLLTAARGVVGVFKSIGETVRAVGPIGGAAFGVFSAAMVVARVEGNKLQVQIKNIFAARTKQSEDLARTLEAEKVAAEKNLEAQSKAVQKLIADYENLKAAIAAGTALTTARDKAQADLKRAQIDKEEQRALGEFDRKRAGGTRTEQEQAQDKLAREALVAQFARRRQGFEDEQARADISNLASAGRSQVEMADEQERKLRTQRDALTLDATTKRADAEAAKKEVSQLARREGVDARTTQDARTAAAALERGAKDSEKALKEFSDAVEATARDLASLRSEGQAKIEQAGIMAQTQEAKVATEEGKARSDTAPRLQELRAQSQAAMERGDFAGQDAANAQIVELERGLKAGAQREKGNAAALGQSLNTARPRPAAEAGLTITMREDQTDVIRKGSAALVAAQERQAGAFLTSLDIQRMVAERNAKKAEQTNRRMLNAREQ